MTAPARPGGSSSSSAPGRRRAATMCWSSSTAPARRRCRRRSGWKSGSPAAVARTPPTTTSQRSSGAIRSRRSCSSSPPTPSSRAAFASTAPRSPARAGCSIRSEGRSDPLLRLRLWSALRRGVGGRRLVRFLPRSGRVGRRLGWRGRSGGRLRRLLGLRALDVLLGLHLAPLLQFPQAVHRMVALGPGRHLVVERERAHPLDDGRVVEVLVRLLVGEARAPLDPQAALEVVGVGLRGSLLRLLHEGLVLDHPCRDLTVEADARLLVLLGERFAVAHPLLVVLRVGRATGELAGLLADVGRGFRERGLRVRRRAERRELADGDPDAVERALDLGRSRRACLLLRV